MPVHRLVLQYTRITDRSSGGGALGPSLLLTLSFRRQSLVVIWIPRTAFHLSILIAIN